MGIGSRARWWGLVVVLTAVSVWLIYWRGAQSLEEPFDDTLFPRISFADRENTRPKGSNSDWVSPSPIAAPVEYTDRYLSTQYMHVLDLPLTYVGRYRWRAVSLDDPSHSLLLARATQSVEELNRRLRRPGRGPAIGQHSKMGEPSFWPLPEGGSGPLGQDGVTDRGRGFSRSAKPIQETQDFCAGGPSFLQLATARALVSTSARIPASQPLSSTFEQVESSEQGCFSWDACGVRKNWRPEAPLPGAAEFPEVLLVTVKKSPAYQSRYYDREGHAMADEPFQLLVGPGGELSIATRFSSNEQGSSGSLDPARGSTSSETFYLASSHLRAAHGFPVSDFVQRNAEVDRRRAQKSERCFSRLSGTRLTQTTPRECAAARGVWDRPCRTDSECPYYRANRNYQNSFGGCNRDTGRCELPQGLVSLGYHYYRPSTAPWCHNCPDGEVGACCQQQTPRGGSQSALETPDYAFSGDRRSRYQQRFELRERGLW